MLQDVVTKDSTNRSVTILIVDSTTGLPETAVEHNTAGIDLWYRREGAAKSSITEAALAALTTAHTDGGIEHISDGVYRLDLPDAAFATGAEHVDFGGTVTGMIVIGGRVRLADLDVENATPDANVTKWLGTAAATPTTAGVPEVDLTFLGGSAQSMTDLKDFADAGYDPATNKVQGVVLTDTLTTYTGNTVQTGDSFARIGAAGASLTDLGGMSTTMKAEVKMEADAALKDIGLDHLMASALPTSWAVDVAAGSVFDQLADDGTAVYDRTTDSLQAISDSGGGGPTAVQIRQEIDTNSTQLALIVADTNELQTDWANGGRLDLLLDAIPTTAMRGTDSAALASVCTEARLAELDAANLPADVDAILLDTGTTLPATLAGLNDLSAAAVAAELATYDGPTNAEMTSAFTEIKGATWDSSDTLENIFTNTVAINTNALLVLADTAEIGTAGAGLTDLGGMSTTMKAQVNTEADAALTDYDGPTNTEMTAAFTEIKGATWSAVTDTLEAIRDRGDAAWITAVGFSTLAATDILSDGTALNTTAGVLDVVNLANTTTTNTDMRGTDSAALASGVAVTSLTSAAITDIWSTDTLTEAYAADGAAGTPAQILYMIQQATTEASITSTTLTVKKLDGSTTAATFTLDDATTPTSRTRAT